MEVVEAFFLAGLSNFDGVTILHNDFGDVVGNLGDLINADSALVATVTLVAAFWPIHREALSDICFGKPLFKQRAVWNLEGLFTAAQSARKSLRNDEVDGCLLYTSPSPRDKRQSRMPSSA